MQMDRVEIQIIGQKPFGEAVRSVAMRMQMRSDRSNDRSIGQPIERATFMRKRNGIRVVARAGVGLILQ